MALRYCSDIVEWYQRMENKMAVRAFSGSLGWVLMQGQKHGPEKLP
jgi:hypothetical protein